MSSFSQVAISGKIVDKNGEPLPFVHLHIENSNIGTISNEDGLFQIATNQSIGKKRIIVSAIGYKTEKIYVQDEYRVISLEQDITTLKGVTLFPKDYGKELVEKAINAIPINYPKVEERHTGFFRETTNWKKNKTPIYIAEAVIEAVKKPYFKKHLSGDVKVNKFRKYVNEQLDSLNTRIYAGGHHIHRFDIVARRGAFLGNPNSFEYKIRDTLTQKGKDIFKIEFQNNNGLSGHVFIMDSSFAIVKAKIKNSSFTSFLNVNGRQYLEYIVTYEQGEDSIWRFKYSRYETIFDKKSGSLQLISDYVTTKVEANEGIIPYSERLQYGDILLNESKKYEHDFWSDYNIIIPNQETESLFKSMVYSKTVKNKNRKNKLVDFLRKIDHEILISGSWLTMDSNTTTFDNTALVVQENMTSSKEYALGLSYSLMYEIKSNLFLGYSTENKISETGITSHDLSLSKRLNVNPNGRPIFISPGMNFGSQKLDFFIGSYNIPTDLVINGKSFDTEKVDVFISQKNIRLQPNVSIGIEKSRRLLFKISIGHNFQFNEKKGLFFQENSGFFTSKQKTFLKNRNENLSIDNANKNLLQNNINIKAGVVFSF
ncbi:MAG: carboxypeptidase-like regulatory domain-containing protein [Algicola sp.]|nr:carboxypeptidase-like regulatory domain-containing protein [Algicola sp.]